MHADKVVRVHDGVDEAVEHDSQVNVAVVAGVHVHPVELRKHRKTTSAGTVHNLGRTSIFPYIHLALVLFTADKKRTEK